MNYFYISIFGAIGAGLRFGVNTLFANEGFPFSTLIVNLVGCFLLAFIVKYISTLSIFSEEVITGLSTGLIGSFTTFSAFSVEVSNMLIDEMYMISFFYVIVSLIAGALSVWAGIYVSERLLEKRELKKNVA